MLQMNAYQIETSCKCFPSRFNLIVFFVGGNDLPTGTPKHTSAVGAIAPVRAESRKLSSGKQIHYSSTTVLP